MWHQTLEWDSCWTARRRGIYPLDHVLLRSGDGFGLTQIEKPYPVERSPVFVVYPRIVPVRTDLFLQNLWDAKSGAKGYFEDPNVIRGERAYQSTDPWKRINWRMAARKEELEVKLYEARHRPLRRRSLPVPRKASGRFTSLPMRWRKSPARGCWTSWASTV